MSTTRRDPSRYHPTVHAGQQAKDRDIDWELVADAIETGTIRDAPGRHCRQFVYNPEDLDEAIYVVANVESGEILTVAWGHDD